MFFCLISIPFIQNTFRQLMLNLYKLRTKMSFETKQKIKTTAYTAHRSNCISVVCCSICSRFQSFSDVCRPFTKWFSKILSWLYSSICTIGCSRTVSVWSNLHAPMAVVNTLVSHLNNARLVYKPILIQYHMQRTQIMYGMCGICDEPLWN